MADPRVFPLLLGRRRAHLRCCLERLKQQVPVGAGPSRSTTLSLLHRARLHIQVRGDAGPGITREVLCGNRAAQLSPRLWLTGSPQRLEEQELRARRAKDRLRDRQRSLQRRLELLLLPTDGERARADSLDSSQLSEPSEEGKKGERKNESRQGVKAAKGLTWPSPVPRGCRGRGGWCGVQRGPAAQLWHRQGPQLLQPPQPHILMVPAAFPALPACLLPAGNPASASLITAARVRGHRWGHESGFTPHSWVALAVAQGCMGLALHCGTCCAPQGTGRGAGRRPSCH